MFLSGSVPHRTSEPLISQPSAAAASAFQSAAAESWVAQLIDGNRILLFSFCALLQLISFNGQWRIGLDSALYRGLADALATGRGYQFGEFGTTTAYPGLPVLLAGLQKVFGLNVFSPWQSVALMMLMAGATLVITYFLIKLHYPRWVAVTVVCGLAVNSRFLQLSHELLTDIPFLLGVVSALFGWELLRRAASTPSLLRAAGICIFGLLLAATMRPTFWVVAVAWLIVATFDLFRRRDRNAVVAIAVLVLVVATVFTLDPRTRNWRILEGGYEQELLAILQDAGADSDSRAPALFTRLTNNVPRLILENFPEAFLGQGLPWGLAVIPALLLLAGSVLLFRRHALWSLLILGTVAVTLMLTTTPRYYLMVMPLLLLAWLMVWLQLRQLVGGGAGEMVLLCGLGLATGLNLAKSVPFIIEQRQTPFVENYRKGKFLPTIAMGEQIKSIVPPGEKVIGPQAQVLRFLSGRDVMMQRELLPPRKSPKSYANVLAGAKIPWAVLPGDPYREVDPDIARMIDRRVVRAVETVATIDAGWKLCRVQTIAPPEGTDWRDLPIQKKPPIKKVVKAKPKKTPEQIAAAKRREEAAAKAARQARIERREAAAKKAEVAARKAAAERKLAIARKAERERRQLAAEAKARREAAAARKTAIATREAKARRQAAIEAKARRDAKLRKAKRAAKQPSTQPATQQAALLELNCDRTIDEFVSPSMLRLVQEARLLSRPSRANWSSRNYNRYTLSPTIAGLQMITSFNRSAGTTISDVIFLSRNSTSTVVLNGA